MAQARSWVAKPDSTLPMALAVVVQRAPAIMQRHGDEIIYPNFDDIDAAAGSSGASMRSKAAEDPTAVLVNDLVNRFVGSQRQHGTQRFIKKMNPFQDSRSSLRKVLGCLTLLAMKTRRDSSLGLKGLKGRLKLDVIQSIE